MAMTHQTTNHRSRSFIATIFVGVALATWTSSVQAGWFSNSYNCENKAVISRVQEMIACELLIQCGLIGLDYAQIATMTKEQLIAKLESLYEPEVEAAARRVTTELNLPIIRKALRQRFNNTRDVFLTYPTLFQNVNVLTDDYRENISRYSCRFTYTYNPDIYVPLWKLLLTSKLAKDRTISSVAEDIEKKNPNADYIAGLVGVAMQQYNIVGKSRSPERKAAIFTVQPNNDTFIIEIKNTDELLPGL